MSFSTKRKADVAYLKTAYIGAFALFGYTYVLRPCFDRIRTQITETSEMHVANPRGRLRNTALPANALLLFHKPVKCVVAKIGDYSVFLPWLDYTPEFWEWHENRDLSDKAPVTFGGGKVFSWPTKMEMILDFT